MKKWFLILILFFQCVFSQEIPKNIRLLMKHYPDVVGFKNNNLIFKDGSTLVYDDLVKNKSIIDLYNSPDIEDQFHQEYPKNFTETIEYNFGPGRFRNEAFFMKIYGKSKTEVEKNLKEITWCPKLVNQKIRVTTKNNVNKVIKSLSDELDTHPEFLKYLTKIGGSFAWRKIAGTERMSMHSFGMTIDINTKFSNYWQWDCKCKNEDSKTIKYKNKIPLELVKIFEKHGFIWGGKWYNYDTMHFEYRPELLD